VNIQFLHLMCPRGYVVTGVPQTGDLVVGLIDEALTPGRVS
jgi:hypothetical protein